MKVRLEYDQDRTSHHSGGDGPYEGYTTSTTTMEITKAWLYRSEKDKVGSSGSFFGHEEELVSDDGIIPKDGDNVYIVVARYSTGSTFGRSNGNFEFMSAHTTEEGANKAKEKLDEEYRWYQESRGYSLYGKTKKPVPYTGPSRSWMGYFESLESVDVVEMPAFIPLS